MLTSERRAWIRIGVAARVTPHTVRQLLDAFGSPVHGAQAPRRALARVFGARRAASLRAALDDVDVDGVVADAEVLGHEILTPDHPDWPVERFFPLADPPTVLFLAGRLPPSDAPTVALVGTRETSRYGLETAREMAADLARRGVWIVSGFAVGVDAAAHAGALEPEGGRTLAVLGTGLDIDYPASNAALRERMRLRGGALVSEYAPGTRPARWTFPRRNRIVAALADAIVVVEAPERSGALITAGIGLELGREILAVPGHIRRHTQRGCHKLIKRGAALCEGTGDVLAALDMADPGRVTASREPAPGPGFDVWQLLDPDDAQDADSLCRATGLEPGALLTALGLLELEGFALKVPGVGYVRVEPGG